MTAAVATVEAPSVAVMLVATRDAAGRPCLAWRTAVDDADDPSGRTVYFGASRDQAIAVAARLAAETGAEMYVEPAWVEPEEGDAGGTVVDLAAARRRREVGP